MSKLGYGEVSVIRGSERELEEMMKIRESK